MKNPTLVVLLGGLAVLLVVFGRMPYALAQTPLAAWVQLVGQGSKASIRVIVAQDAACPTLMADDRPLNMAVRAEPTGLSGSAASFHMRGYRPAGQNENSIEWNGAAIATFTAAANCRVW
jgi:hypothetical protein